MPDANVTLERVRELRNEISLIRDMIQLEQGTGSQQQRARRERLRQIQDELRELMPKS